MSPSSAKRISPALAAALSAGDLEAASAGFASDACLITPDATLVRGRQSIRSILYQLIAMRPTARVEQQGILIAGSIALASEAWTMRFEDSAGAPFTQSTNSTAVLRRVEDVWKFQIAAPWGWG